MYYAVAKGRKLGIFTDFEEYKKSVLFYPSCRSKKFKNEAKALEYLKANGVKVKNSNSVKVRAKKRDIDYISKNFLPNMSKECLLSMLPANSAIVFTDGSYRDGVCGIGGVFLHQNDCEEFSLQGTWAETNKYANISGEIAAAQHAMQIAISKNVSHLLVCYDCTAVVDWATSEKRGALAKEYFTYCKKTKPLLNVVYMKVKSHSGCHLNCLADRLAKVK